VRTALTHPDWCDPRLCRVHPTFVSHLSAPDTWQAVADDIEYTLQRYQDGDDAGEPMLLLRWRRLGGQWDELLVSQEDLDRFATAVNRLGMRLPRH
jgi:hypothetical protein